MTIWRQRFFRWNFFYVLRVYSNACYILLAWRLGWRELVTKIFVFGEIYDSIIMLASPLLAPVVFITAWQMGLLATGILLLSTILALIFFNAFSILVA